MIGREGGKRCRAAKKDSPKCRPTISSGERTAVRLMREFQRSNISMYVDICCDCTADGKAGCPRDEGDSTWVPAKVGLGLRKGLNSSAMRAGSTGSRL